MHPSSGTYDHISVRASQLVTHAYSTSFGLAIRLMPPQIRQHIYNIYGLVRLADEIVDTYTGPDQRKILDGLEAETYAALTRGYSANIIVHAFAITARRYGIGKELIKPFFASMRSDITKRSYSASEYRQYIYGSAETIGLMCLRVFCDGGKGEYATLKPGAQALGSAFQKVNFLRDLAADSQVRQRVYLPDVTLESLDEPGKRAVIAGIRSDFAEAKQAIKKLPADIRPAVQTASDYFEKLLDKIERTPVSTLKTRRLRISNALKTAVFLKALAKHRITRSMRR